LLLLTTSWGWGWGWGWVHKYLHRKGRGEQISNNNNTSNKTCYQQRASEKQAETVVSTFPTKTQTDGGWGCNGQAKDLRSFYFPGTRAGTTSCTRNGFITHASSSASSTRPSHLKLLAAVQADILLVCGGGGAAFACCWGFLLPRHG